MEPMKQYIQVRRRGKIKVHKVKVKQGVPGRLNVSHSSYVVERAHGRGVSEHEKQVTTWQALHLLCKLVLLSSGSHLLSCSRSSPQAQTMFTRNRSTSIPNSNTLASPPRSQQQQRVSAKGSSSLPNLPHDTHTNQTNMHSQMMAVVVEEETRMCLMLQQPLHKSLM